jgi:hypothetical protein
MFQFAGEVRWTGIERTSALFGEQDSPVSGAWAVPAHHALVDAAQRLHPVESRALDDFNLSALVPYDPQYLVDWPAETYRLTLDEAAVVARRQALPPLRALVEPTLEDIRDLDVSFARVAIDAFKLLLLPVWIARMPGSRPDRRAIVNGQTGSVHGSHQLDPARIVS